MMCVNLLSAISSQGLAGGRMPYNLQAGIQQDLFGQQVVLANRFRAQVCDEENLTTDTCGQHCSLSSESASLQRSLANKLWEMTDLNGSVQYSLTWKALDMPLRVPICALLASVRRTLDKDSIGLPPIPTPTACDGKGSGRGTLKRKETAISGWGLNLRDWFLLRYNFLYPPVEIVRWLMGYPIGWANCAPATPSSRKSPHNSSALSSMRKEN